MPQPTAPVKRVCYADDITIWATGVKIPELTRKINDYLKEMSLFLKANSLLISAPKSSVRLFTPNPAQAHYHPATKIEGSRLPLECSPKLPGVYLDTFFSFNYHCGQVTTRVKKRNNVLKALTGTSWGQQKETLQMTYKARGRSIANYAAPVWSTNGHHHWSVEVHLNLLSAQYLIQCLEPDSACNNITRMDTRIGVKYSTYTWYLYLSTYLSVLDVLEYLVYGNAKVLVLVLVLDQKVLGTYK